MTMWLIPNTQEGQASHGLLAGLARMPYRTRDGITIFYNDTEIEMLERVSGEEPVRAAPGMVGVNVRGGRLLVIDANGDGHSIPAIIVSHRDAIESWRKIAEFIDLDASE